MYIEFAWGCSTVGLVGSKSKRSHHHHHCNHRHCWTHVAFSHTHSLTHTHPHTHILRATVNYKQHAHVLQFEFRKHTVHTKFPNSVFFAYSTMLDSSHLCRLTNVIFFCFRAGCPENVPNDTKAADVHVRNGQLIFVDSQMDLLATLAISLICPR